MDKKIIALIVVVLLVVIAAAYVLATQSPATNTTVVNNTTNTSNITHSATKHTNVTPQNNTPNVKISAAQAQKIAIGAAQELGGENDTAGTPTLFKWTANKLHTWAWDVPLFDAVTKKSAGSMDVDAMTGEVIMNE
jgi:hypothetical protein